MNKGNKLHQIALPAAKVSETDKAYGVDHENGKIWLPKSQIKDFQRSKTGIKFWCPEWLVIEKGLEMYIDTSHEPTLFER